MCPQGALQDCLLQWPVDPALVPKRKLYTGALMPAIGLGTFGSDRVSADGVAQAVSGALEVGYRHFDCASVYGNEDRIGQVLEGFPREQLWITSKLWNDKHSQEDVIPSCEKSWLTFARTTWTCTSCTGRSQLPPTRLRRECSQPRRSAVYPQRVHGDLAADGKTR